MVGMGERWKGLFDDAQGKKSSMRHWDTFMTSGPPVASKLLRRCSGEWHSDKGSLGVQIYISNYFWKVAFVSLNANTQVSIFALRLLWQWLRRVLALVLLGTYTWSWTKIRSCRWFAVDQLSCLVDILHIEVSAFELHPRGGDSWSQRHALRSLELVGFQMLCLRWLLKLYTKSLPHIFVILTKHPAFQRNAAWTLCWWLAVMSALLWMKLVEWTNNCIFGCGLHQCLHSSIFGKRILIGGDPLRTATQRPGKLVLANQTCRALVRMWCESECTRAAWPNPGCWWFVNQCPTRSPYTNQQGRSGHHWNVKMAVKPYPFHSWIEALIASSLAHVEGRWCSLSFGKRWRITCHPDGSLKASSRDSRREHCEL